MLALRLVTPFMIHSPTSPAALLKKNQLPYRIYLAEDVEKCGRVHDLFHKENVPLIFGRKNYFLIRNII